MLHWRGKAAFLYVLHIIIIIIIEKISNNNDCKQNNNIYYVRSVHFNWFFQDTHLFTVVASVFQPSSLQPRLYRFFTLGAWPTRAREVTPWTGACGSQLVFQGAVGGFSVDPRSSGKFLLQRRSSVATRVLHHHSTPVYGVLYCFFSCLFIVCLCNA
jgi:hypothetical protein